MHFSASVNFWLTIAIVVVTYIGIAIGRWPILKSNRATIALVGTGLLLATGLINLSQIPQYLDFDTLILLFSMMVINANLKLAGFFQLAGDALIRPASSPRIFLAVEILFVGILSAFFLNDTICLMFTPFVLSLMDQLKRNPIPYLIARAAASNAGSTATLTGNPQNMIIGVSSGIPYLQFSAAAVPAALLSMGTIWIVIVILYPYEFKHNPFPSVTESTKTYNRPVLIKTSLVTAGLLTAFLAGVPVPLAAFLGACALLVTRRTAPHLVFAEFDWSLLVFFSGLFIVSSSLVTGGVITQISEAVSFTQLGNVWNLSGITALLSNLVSNVPAVLLLKPLIPGLANPRAGWITLAVASTLAGNLTLLGSVANLIVAEIASRWRVDLSFWEYTRAGLIITLLSLGLSTLWLQFAIW
jgi:Na+/H+ antiporter NhaD/arsenite permease-like protein